MRKQIDGDWIPVGNYQNLVKRVRWAERLNLVLFIMVLLISFGAFVAIGAHTYRYEKRLDQAVKTFKEDILAITGDQNIAIEEINRIVLDRNWIKYQRMTLEQLEGFCDLRDKDPEMFVIFDNESDKGVGGK